MDRSPSHGVCGCLCAAAALLALAGSVPSAAFTLDDVEERARALVRGASAPCEPVPGGLEELSYDEWRKIRFRPAASLWSRSLLGFQVQFFHPGLYYPHTVRVHEVDAAGVHRVEFSPEQFDYAATRIASRVPRTLGYAGFRVLHPLKDGDALDEVIAFLGASYFRALGRNEVYGLSARGLAIDTAVASGEEFPSFCEFWLVRPEAGARALTIFALLDSRRVAGAYRFTVEPGVQTRVQVEARLFPRQAVSKLGVAPLTSMFLHGENSAERARDYRPEVHDSDGLLAAFADTGEWLWRPLENPRSLRVSRLAAQELAGFGLLQRDRDFDHYQDLGTRAELRPSAWVVPRGDWGRGSIELVEIPTALETNDNVVAYWVPDRMPGPGESLAFAYDLFWYGAARERSPGGIVRSTRRDGGSYPGAHRFVIDFAGGTLAALSDAAPVRGRVSTGARPGQAELLEQQVSRNPATGGWRLVFQVRPLSDEPAELRAFLQLGDDVLTETWSAVLEP